MFLIDDTTVFTYANVSGTVPDTAIPSLIARDQEVSDAITAAQTGNRDRANHTGLQGIDTVSGLQTALNQREGLLSQVATKSGNYTAAAGEAVPLDTTNNGSFTLTFPTGAAVGARVAARWVAGVASPIISAPAGELIGASQTQSMNLGPATTSGEFIVWQKWTSSVWLPTGGFKPQAALDARYDAKYQAIEAAGSTAFRAHNTTIQSIANAADVVTSFPTVTRPSALVTASTEGAGHKFTLNRAGFWVGNATVRLIGGNAGEMYAAAFQNVGGAVSILGATNAAYANNAAPTRQVNLSGYFAVGTAVYVTIFQSSGSSKNTDPNAGNWCQINLGWVHS